MARISEILELLGNLILSTMDNTIKINKYALMDIHCCLQDVLEKIDFFAAWIIATTRGVTKV